MNDAVLKRRVKFKPRGNLMLSEDCGSKRGGGLLTFTLMVLRPRHWKKGTLVLET